MKNIFLKETDKPSYLFIIDKSKMFVPEAPYLSYTTVGGRVHKTEGSDIYRPQFIYIINDEKIEDGNWVFQECLNMPHRLIKTDTENVKVLNDLNKCKKIVLTNDTSLIEDGVQSIDDEFLEWFVKNPSCEEVEVILDRMAPIYYEIIIPKERQKSLVEKMKPSQEQWQKDMDNFLNSKQETPEEAAERLTKDFSHYSVRGGNMDDSDIKGWFLEALQKGAKWQAEKMYSEEDLHNAFYNGWIYRGENYTFPKAKKEWLEQFKNR